MHVVLNSFGASIHKENGLFAVSTASGKQTLNPMDIKSVTVSRGARISSDAVLLAIEHEIDVLFVDKVGTPKGRIWSVKYGSVSDIRRKQLEFLYSIKANNWVKDMVIEKINNQVAILLSLQLNADEATQRKIKSSLNSLEDYKAKVRTAVGTSVSVIAPSLRGWEGAAAKRYFEAINWCIPVQYQFEKRSQHPAKDWFNSMLNYGYGMLYGKIEGALIKAGIDPYVGVFHRDDYNRPALVFDIIEKYRIWVDYVVIRLVQQEAMSEECFVDKDGAMWLDGLGKRILIQSINDYLSEVIHLKGLDRSRGEHIQSYAHQLAQYFLKS